MPSQDARARGRAEVIAPNPAALQLRYLQTLAEIGAQHNSTIVFPLPLDIVRPFLDGSGARGDATEGENPARKADAPGAVGPGRDADGLREAPGRSAAEMTVGPRRDGS